ncbi:hypothetical protein [Diaphorobacter sp.]|uniref:hypothetical protein n=1 Tax=Diaphorobacter sp. TaxID=1934310 RepID=UPI0025888EFC|nr:hypothetical protein [Diaphorobacter sp.]
MSDIGERAIPQRVAPSDAGYGQVSGSRERQGCASVASYVARIRGLDCESGAEERHQGAQYHLAKSGVHGFLDRSDALSAFEHERFVGFDALLGVWKCGHVGAMRLDAGTQTRQEMAVLPFEPQQLVQLNRLGRSWKQMLQNDLTGLEPPRNPGRFSSRMTSSTSTERPRLGNPEHWTRHGSDGSE